jgi:hypothetical protein
VKGPGPQGEGINDKSEGGLANAGEARTAHLEEGATSQIWGITIKIASISCIPTMCQEDRAMNHKDTFPVTFQSGHIGLNMLNKITETRMKVEVNSLLCPAVGC